MASKLPQLTGVWQIADERRSGMAVYAGGEAFEIDVHTCQWLSDVPFVLAETESGATVSRQGELVASLRLDANQVQITSPDGKSTRAAVRSTTCPLPADKPRPGSVAAP